MSESASESLQFLRPIAANSKSAVEEVSVGRLRLGDSPRLSGEDPDHVRVLAQVESGLPPLLVHRSTMRVIDGAHRLKAAMSRGCDTVTVQFFEGTVEAAFVLAVQANMAHGLPLTLTDRRAAARRIIESDPGRSDRWTAEVTGLASSTVASIRQQFGATRRPNEARTGRDGRVRPIDGSRGRRLAGRLLAENPDMSVREIAKTAGISVGTAQDVRERFRRRDDPVLPRQRTKDREGCELSPELSSPRREPSTGDVVLLLETLRNDPALRYSETGRQLLRWIDKFSIRAEDFHEVVNFVPPHCVPTVAGLARSLSRTWWEFADELESRSTID